VTKTKENGRFRGFPSETPRFFQALVADPSLAARPADARVPYAAHVLSPLKALVTDLEARLDDVSALVALEARLGASLAWPEGAEGRSDDGPVLRLRAWARGRDADASPILYADFSDGGIEIGLDAGGADPEATARWRAALEADDAARVAAARLLSSGWIVTGEGPSASSDELHPWAWTRGLRIARVEPWGPWIDEPAFAGELAARFRELLPVFERMLTGAPAPSDA